MMSVDLTTLIASIVVIAIIGGAILYIIKEKKKGTKCIGCAASCSCSSKNSKTGGCSCSK